MNFKISDSEDNESVQSKRLRIPVPYGSKDEKYWKRRQVDNGQTDKQTDKQTDRGNK